MRFLMTREQRAKICAEIGCLEFVWTTSRGAATYGYNICTLRIRGRAVARCMGGGYDMRGTALGRWIQAQFPEESKRLNAEKHYGVYIYDQQAKKFRSHYRPGYKIWLDGACGFSSMRTILHRIGFDLTEADINSRRRAVYLLTVANN